MYAAIFVDDYLKLDEQKRALVDKSLVGGAFYSRVCKFEEVEPPCKYIPLTEYEAMGWKFYGVGRGYLKVEPNSPAHLQLPSDKLIHEPRKNRRGEDLNNGHYRYKYILTEEDILQGLAFWNRIQPHVHRATKSQTRSQRYRGLRRFLNRVQGRHI